MLRAAAVVGPSPGKLGNRDNAHRRCHFQPLKSPGKTIHVPMRKEFPVFLQSPLEGSDPSWSVHKKTTPNTKKVDFSPPCGCCIGRIDGSDPPDACRRPGSPDLQSSAIKGHRFADVSRLSYGVIMDFEDKMILCEDCGKEFAHTVEDQKRYAERGFTADPKRCRECREVRKTKSAQAPPRREGGGGRRGSFGGGGGPRRGGGGAGPPRSGGGGGHGDRAPRPAGGGYAGGQGGGFKGPRPSFDAVCAACGVPTTVPFEPREGREVFCRSCYKKLKEG